MQIGVPKETAARERRVALAPDSVGRLVKTGTRVVVEHNAGAAASFPDSAYTAAGATVAKSLADTLADSDVVTKVQAPSAAEARAFKSGAVLVSLFQPATAANVLPALAERSVTALSLERVPRITRAQSMDVLSSQSTVAGYKAVLIGASMMPKFLPMLTTAAGNIAPAKAFILGAGVAGLQAIATARRLGAIVSAFDVRPAVREQVQSLGATFVATRPSRATPRTRVATRASSRRNSNSEPPRCCTITQAGRSRRHDGADPRAPAPAHHRGDGRGHAARHGDRRPRR